MWNSEIYNQNFLFCLEKKKRSRVQVNASDSIMEINLHLSVLLKGIINSFAN